MLPVICGALIRIDGIVQCDENVVELLMRIGLQNDLGVGFLDVGLEQHIRALVRLF